MDVPISSRADCSVPCSVTANISFDSVLFPLLTPKHVEVHLYSKPILAGAEPRPRTMPYLQLVGFSVLSSVPHQCAAVLLRDAKRRLYAMANLGHNLNPVRSRRLPGSQEPDRTHYADTAKKTGMHPTAHSCQVGDEVPSRTALQ